jgi:hypothetical protein
MMKRSSPGEVSLLELKSTPSGGSGNPRKAIANHLVGIENPKPLKPRIGTIRSWHTFIKMKAALIIALSTLAFAGCASHGDEIEAVPFDATIMLKTSDLTNLAPDKGDGLLVFTPAPPALAAVKPGSVLVASASPLTPHGLLRVVKSRTNDGTSLTLETLNAPLQLAFQRVHLKIRPRSSGVISALKGTPNDIEPRSLHARDIGRAGPSQTANASYDADVLLFDGDGDPMTTDDQVEFKGSIEGTVTVGFTLDFDWGSATKELPDAVVSCLASLFLGPAACLDALLPEAKVQMASDAHLSAKAALEGAALADFKKEIKILDVTLTPISLIPVPIVPVVTIVASVEGSASAGFSAGVHAGADITASVSLSSKHLDAVNYQPPKITRVDFGADPPAVTLQAELKASIGAQISILIADVTGPYARADIFAKLGADLTKKPCWGLGAGVESFLGITVKPTLPIIGSITLFDWKASPFSLDLPIANGSCTVPPSISTLPPGSGADAAHYATPTFAPWSRLVASPLDGSFAASPTGDGSDWTDILHTIDGRYLVTGSRMNGPLKLDAQRSTVTWSQRYHEGDANGPALTARRSLQQLDTSIALLTTGPDVASFGLLDIGQAGGIYNYQTVTVNDVNCAPTPRAFVADGAGGFYVAGACNDAQRGFVMRVAAEGTRGFAMTIADRAGSAVSPSVLVAVGGGLVVSGEIHPATGHDLMFVVRLDASGVPKAASAYEGCNDATDVSPTAGMANANGDVTLVGSASAHHVGFLGRLKSDGSVAFASFPGLDLGLSKIFVINAVAELPTTGYVVAGSTVDLLGAEPTNTPATALVGLDSIGRTLWSKRFTLFDAGVPVASGFPSMRLSDDGGVVLAAAAQARGGGEGGRLWAFEAVAKDGTLPGLAVDRAQLTDLGIIDVTCALTSKSFTPSLASLATTAATRVATAETITTSVDKITP